MRDVKEEIVSSASSFSDLRSELEGSSEEVVEWSSESQPFIDDGHFDFLYAGDTMEQGV